MESVFTRSHVIEDIQFSFSDAACSKLHTVNTPSLPKAPWNSMESNGAVFHDFLQ